MFDFKDYETFHSPMNDNPKTFQAIKTDDRVEIGVNQLTRGTPMSAGMDISVWPEEEVTLMPGQKFMFPTGFKLWIGDENVVGIVAPRSSLGVKRGVQLANTIGVIDADYQGEWKICLLNTGDSAVTISPGERVAQVIMMPVLNSFAITQTTEFEETSRGEGGFGSTGDI